MDEVLGVMLCARHDVSPLEISVLFGVPVWQVNTILAGLPIELEEPSTNKPAPDIRALLHDVLNQS